MYSTIHMTIKHVFQDEGSNGSKQLLFVVFLLMISIIVSNLIVGLTVNKTEELFKEAGIIRLEKTVLQVKGTAYLFNT